jgi:hypothetical protein
MAIIKRKIVYENIFSFILCFKTSVKCLEYLVLDLLVTFISMRVVGLVYLYTVILSVIVMFTIKPHWATRKQAIAKTPAKWTAYQIPSVFVVFVAPVFKV